MRAGQLTTATGRRTRATEIARTLVTRQPVPAQPAADSSADPDTPVVLERYRLRRRLGTGGFGTVWMARDERLERDVAIKILPRELVAEGRFEREAHAAARLSHPGIVTLYEAAADDEGAYLVSELVRGTTLQRALTAGRLSDRGILSVGVAVCDALLHAHAEGVVHRDVKPSNILIPASAPDRAKLTDFGVARLIGGDTLTRTGDLIGTAAYMAPEQAEGREAGEAADLFSLALVLYEALTGVNPVSAASGVTGPGRTRRLAQHLAPLRRQRRELPRELGAAIDLALRPRPRERGTLTELRAVLARAADTVSDRPGVVEDPWPTRAASEAERDWSPSRAATRRREPDESTRAGSLRGQRRADRTDRTDRTDRAPARRTDRRAAGTARAARRAPASERPSAPVPVPTRAWSALAAALLAAWASAHLIPSAPVAPAPAALLAALAVVLVPRAAWIILSVAVIVALAVRHRGGEALIVALAAVLPLLALPRRASAWPLAAGAPLLGVVGLAGAWPALAARAATPWQRAGLGALGWAWVLLGGALAGHVLYTQIPVTSPVVWGSLSLSAHGVLVPLVPGALVAGAAVWALGAVTLPALVSHRSGPGRWFVLCAWAAAVSAGTGIALRVAGAGHLAPPPGRFVAGMGACAAIALLSGVAVRGRSGVQTDGTAAGLA